MKTIDGRNRITALAMVVGLAVSMQFASGCAVGRHFEQRWEQAALEATDGYKAARLLVEWEASGQQGRILHLVTHNDLGEDEPYPQAGGESSGAGQIRYMLAHNDRGTAGGGRHLNMGNPDNVTRQTVAYGQAGDGNWAPLRKIAPLETVCGVDDGKLRCFTCMKLTGCVVPVE
jgi:hypothetical protein